LDLPEGSTIETIEKDLVHRVKWKDEHGMVLRAVVTILQNSRLNENEHVIFLGKYESAMKADCMSFTRTKDEQLNALTRQVEFRINIDSDKRSSSTVVLLMGEKVVEVILAHPNKVSPAQSRLNLVKNLKGV
jgi:hypothetical protein